MKITYYGHSCFTVRIKNKEILFDPFISPNSKASMVDVDSLKPDYLLISHGHEDHVADAVRIAKNSGALVVGAFEIINWFAGQGVENGHPMNHGGGWDFDFGRLTFVNAVHSSVLPDGTYGGNPGGFILESGDRTLYFAGDTALTYDMKLIGEIYRPELAMLPIGDNFTMGARDAVMASDFIRCDRIIGMHYDTFPYIEIDHARAKEAFSSKGKELILMDINETRQF